MAVSKGNKKKRAKQTGYQSRSKTKGGKKVLARRRQKGRARLGA